MTSSSGHGVTGKFTLELINHFENGENKTCTITPTWGRPTEECEWKKEFLTVPGRPHHFISHSELPRNSFKLTHFMKNDTLNFPFVSVVVICCIVVCFDVSSRIIYAQVLCMFCPTIYRPCSWQCKLGGRGGGGGMGEPNVYGHQAAPTTVDPR